MNNELQKRLIKELCEYIKNDIDNTPEDKWGKIESGKLDEIMGKLSHIEIELYDLVNE
jgi:hypothetical protein